jgi:hypothetical protein
LSLHDILHPSILISSNQEQIWKEDLQGSFPTKLVCDFKKISVPFKITIRPLLHFDSMVILKFISILEEHKVDMSLLYSIKQIVL